jgi:beta-N-acetylhexosaminidase
MAPAPLSPPLAAIFGLSGDTLNDAERAFFAHVRPLGYILFARNIQNPAQVLDLTSALRALNPGHDPLILIDQEGGRVQRLRPPHWRFAPAAARFGHLDLTDQGAAAKALKLNMTLIGRELCDIGIDVDCAPVLDVPAAGAHDIIGDRAFASDPERVAALGRAAAEGLIDAGVVPVIKHVPGHGRALADSHLELPVVDSSLETLRATDFKAFAAFVGRRPPPVFAMTAHVVYRAVDPDRPATQSSRVIAEVIRGEIGFNGLLMSDDLSMQALSGDFEDRTARSLAAGCDVVLHCNGSMPEMTAIARAARPLGERGLAAMAAVAPIRRKPRRAIEHVAAAEVEVLNLLRRA